jgi:hypothetical protein
MKHSACPAGDLLLMIRADCHRACARVYAMVQISLAAMERTNL